MTGKKTLLFLHGINNDHPDGDWRVALDGALRRDGAETLEEKGFSVVAPSYLHLLSGEPPEDDEPDDIRLRPKKQVGADHAGVYLLRQNDLERALDGVTHSGPALHAGTPIDPVVPAVAPHVTAQAASYVRSERRRRAILRTVLDELPDEGRLVIVAYSLGTVVAADLIYHLPRKVTVDLLLTAGSPLGHPYVRKHLVRLTEAFPFHRVESWLNVVGRGDPVTMSRGIARVFPEACDAFVDTGVALAAHDARKYLSQDVVVRALEWVTRPKGAGEVVRADQPLEGPLVAIVAGAQYALRVEQSMESGKRRRKFGDARALVNSELATKADSAGIEHPVFNRLSRDNSEVIRGRLDPPTALTVLLTAWQGNPIAPYEIDVDLDDRRAAIANLADDLGLPARWAEVVEDVSDVARKAHSGPAWGKAAGVAIGVVTIAAAPVLVLAAAPAALAGGAAIVGGLAALGPGGMLGGLAVVGAVGGIGGTVTAAALIGGSSAELQKNVILMQSHAEACYRLQITGHRYETWHALVAMESQLASDQERLARVCDSDSKVLREANRKLDSVQNALNWMALRGLAPAEATIGEDPGEERAAVENSERDAGRRRLTTGPWRRKAPSDEVD